MPALALAFSRTDTPGRSASSAAAAAGEPSDAQILALAVESRHEAFDAMYTAYKARIYTFLLRLLGDPELADDVTQDAFTKAYQALPSLERGTKVLPWLYRVASNAGIDHLRRRNRFRWLRVHAIEDTHDEPRSADSQHELGERDHIQAVLRKLPLESAAALVLHAVEGYSYKEIAEIQGCSMTAVRSRIARARVSFQKMYATTEGRQTS